MKNKIFLFIIVAAVIFSLSAIGSSLVITSKIKPSKKTIKNWSRPKKSLFYIKLNKPQNKIEKTKIKKENEISKTLTNSDNISTQKNKKKINNSNGPPDNSTNKTDSTNKTKSEPTNNLITVKLDINTGQNKYSYNVSVKDSSTVYDVLKTASKEHNFTLKVTNYSYGIFVEEIAGVANNSSDATYWLYYINGKLANLGASNQKVKKGDDILWNYEKT